MNNDTQVRTCSLDGCDRKHVAKGYCRPHWKRFNETGDPGPVEVRLHNAKRGCAVDGCARPHATIGYCEVHARRVRETGDPGSVEIVMGGWTGAEATYKAVHIRLGRVRGKAGQFACSCGKPAEDWAYDHLDPNEKRNERGVQPWSTDLNHYRPMCKPCHGRFDAEHRP